MRSQIFVRLLSFFLGLIFSSAMLFGGGADGVPAPAPDGAPRPEHASPGVPAPAETVPAKAPEREKLFYKISLNESFFIHEKEAVVNARATVEVLQGELDKVSLEVFGAGSGQGEIFNVAGTQVKDWSVRREGSRTFLEIRPKDLGGEKTFTVTISGRQPLKLPATISPLLFSGADSTAFLGVVQFLASADLRLYAKQERGLVPLGERSRSEINYGIQGTPSLRLDIARANELLAPVSLEDFSLNGDVEPAGTRFRLKAKALVREIGAEVPVLTGNAALLDFPEKNSFVVLAKTDAESGQTEYSLRFPARGEFDVELTFDAGIEDADGWRRMNFSVPAAQVAPYSLSGMPEDTVFAADNVSIPQQRERGVFSGFLPSSGALDLRWRPSIPTPPEFSAGVYSIDAVSEMQISTGVLAQRTEMNFTISQGEISSLFFEISGEGEILSVEGNDLLAWREIFSDGGKKRGLFVQLSQPKAEKYRLRVLTQTRTGEFPKTLRPLRFVPARTDAEGLPLSAVCVRSGEFLRLRNGVGIRCEAVPQAGMTQVQPSAFPQSDDFFEKDVPEDGVSVYRLSSETEKLCVKADFIRSELIVMPRMRWLFEDEKITLAARFAVEVRDAPLYEMRILVPDDLEPVLRDSDVAASWETTDDSGTPGYRLLNLVFSEPLLGSARVVLTLQKTGTTLGRAAELRPCLFPQARFVFGVMALSGQKNFRLLPERAENLSEIAPNEYNPENPPQIAFRTRGGNWKLTVRPEPRPTVLGGVSSCVYKVGNDRIFGNLNVKYSPRGVPVRGVRLAFPRGAKVLSVSGENVRDWNVAPDGTASVALAAETENEFSVSATFEEPRADGAMQAFEGVELIDVVGESGTVLITADRVLTVAGEESVRPLAPLPLGDVPADYVQRGGAILFRAYQFVERPFRLALETRLPAEEATPPIVVTEARVTSDAGRGCDVVYRCRSFGATELRVGVPAGMKILCDGAKAQPDGTVLLPLPPDASEISLRMMPSVPAPNVFRETKLLLPRVFAPVAKTVFTGCGDAESETMRVVAAGRRVNDAIDASFFRRFFARFMEGRYVVVISFLALVASLIVANFADRRRFYRACLSVALLAGSALTISVAWWLVETVRPEYGETVLFAGATDAGTQLDVTLRRFYFLGGNDPAPSFTSWLLVGVFCVGVFLLLYGTVFRRRHLRLRLLGRVLLYGAAAVFAAEDFPYRVSAFIAMTLAVEISVLISFFMIRFTAKIMDTRPGIPLGGTGTDDDDDGGAGTPPTTNPPAAGSAGTLALFAAALLPAAFAFAPDARAEETVHAAEEFSVPAETVSESVPAIHTLAAAEETPHDVADRITQAIDVRPDRIVARGDVRVTGVAGDRFNLLASPAVLTSFEKTDNAMLRLERIRAADAGFVYQVVLERAGTFSAKFSYELALSEKARGFPILTGAAAADVATVHVPRAEVQISAKGSVTTTLTAFGEKSQLAQIVFKPHAERRVQWNPRERDRSREEPRVFASGDNLYVPSAGVIEGRHVMKFVPAQGEISRLRISIPKPFSVSRIEGPAIHRWNFNRDSGVLSVLFTAPRTAEFSLAVFTQAQLSFLPATQKFSALGALDCDVQVRTIGVATGEALQLDAVRADGLVSIDEEEFLGALDAAGLKMEPGLRLRRAFRTVDSAGDFEAELSAVQPNLRIESTEDFFVNSDFVRAEIAFSASVSRAELFSISFRIPAGIDVDSIRGDLLSYWTRVPAEDGSARVTMYLKNALEGTQDFTVRLSGAFPQGAKEWELPSFVVENAKIQRGNVSVSVDEGLRLSPASSGSAMFAETSADGRSDTFRFRYFNRGGDSPKFSVLESKPFTNASWLHLVSPRGRYAFSRVSMIFGIENVTRSSVRVRLPEDALAVRFFGDEIVSAEKIADAADGAGTAGEGAPAGTWELKFSKPIRGNVSASAEFFTPLPLAASARVRSVSVEDADRQSAWLAVERGGVFTALKSHSPEKVSADDVPAEFRSELAGRDVFVEKYAEKYPADVSIAPAAVAAWRESLSDAHRDSFSAETLARFTVFDGKTAVTEEKISLRAERSDVLRIALPEGGELKSVALNGVPADVVSAASEAGAGTVFLPIFAKFSAPQTVSVVYAHPLRESLRGERRVREIVPAEIISAERMQWSLRALGGEAEILDVFGRDPEKVREAPTGGADFLEAYFGGNASRERSSTAETERGNASDDDEPVAASGEGWETFFVAGRDNLKSRAVVAFGRRKGAAQASDFGIFLTLLAALALLKTVQFLRFRKNLRK